MWVCQLISHPSRLIGRGQEYEAGQRLGLPLIYGEYAHHGGYHYYPNDEQVRNWFAETRFTLLEVTEGDEYRHYLTRVAP